MRKEDSILDLIKILYYEKLFNGFSVITLLRIFQKLAGLAVTYILVRLLTKEDYGNYIAISSLVGILGIFSLLELNNSVMQSVARGYYGIIPKALKYSVLGSIFGGILMLCISFYFYFHGREDMFTASIVGALFLPFYMGLLQWRHRYMAEQRYSLFCFTEGCSIALTSLGVIIGAYFSAGDYIYPVIALFGIPSLFNLALSIPFLLNKYHELESEEGSFEYGIKTSIYSSLNVIALHADKLLLYFFLSPAILAIYTAADKIAELMRGVTQDMAGVMSPWFAKNKTYSHSINRIINLYSACFGIVIVVFAFTLLPSLLILIFGEPYRESVPYAQALVVAVAIGNAATLKFRYIRSQLDTKNFRNVTIYTSLARIGLSVTLIPFLGIIGAVASVFIYRILMAITVHIVMKKSYAITDHD